MTDGCRTPDHGHPISSPCEPNGSGELKIGIPQFCYLKVGYNGLYITQTCYPEN